MHIALAYRWYPHNPFIWLENALCKVGHTITYIGLPGEARAGYDSRVPLPALIAALPQKPDLYLWIDPGGPYFPRGIEDLDIPTAGYLVDVHLGSWREYVALFFDGVFVTERDFLDRYRTVVGHSQVFHLPLAIEPAVCNNRRLPRTYDVGFVGNLVRAHRKTPRARQLKLIASRFKTNDFYRNYTPDELSLIYNQSRIVFNTSITGGVTIRIFEGTACGALVLTDTRPEALGDLYTLGVELAPYSNDDDLVAKIAYYLTHDAERERMAQAGYQRAHSQHTYWHRAQTMTKALANGLQPLAPMRQASPAMRFKERRKIYTHLYMLDAILDDARQMKHHPLRRLGDIAPCLIRRLLI